MREMPGRGGSHGARAGPACAKHPCDSGELVLSLYDGEGGFAFRGDAELLEKVGVASMSDVEGVMGYQATTVTPAKHGAHAGCACRQ